MIILGYDVSLEQKVFDKFNDIINGESFEGNGGKCVYLSYGVNISDLEELSPYWMYVYIDLMDKIKYEIRTQDGHMIIDSEDKEFPLVKADGSLSRMNGIDMEKDKIMFQKMFKECIDGSGAKVVLSELVGSDLLDF